ncbi:hypothetical protein GGF46_004713 [Coemansia sp. RSA 552]|nr:hypothetical protein GGF46_004713 [Coemansia sp. RSA 552]
MDPEAGVTEQQQEAMYDGQADTKDAEWVSRQRPGKTDAVLSCPLCFAQICFLCQAHARYKGQYRALSVENCTVHKDQRYWFGKSGRLEPLDPDSVAAVEEEVYALVVCDECGTKVGVQGADGEYHLFHVLPDIQG